MRVRPATLAVAGLLLCALPSLATKDELLRVAPDYLVKSWGVVKDTTLYGSGNGITSIYNGGYEVYTKAGVTEALRRMYSQKDAYVEVTVHKMKSEKAAISFLGNRYRTETRKTPPTRNFRRFTVSAAGSTTTYSASGKWFFTVMTYGTSSNDKKAVTAFIAALEKRV